MSVTIRSTIIWGIVYEQVWIIAPTTKEMRMRVGAEGKVLYVYDACHNCALSPGAAASKDGENGTEETRNLYH